MSPQQHPLEGLDDVVMSVDPVIEKLQEMFAGEEEFWVEESLRGDSKYRAECLARARSFQTAREWTESMSVWVK